VTWKNGGRRPWITLGEVLLAPWSSRTWLATAHVLTGAPIALGAASVVSLAAGTALTLAITIVAIPLGLAMVLTCSRWFTNVQRSRVAAFMDVHIPPVPSGAEGSTVWNRLVAETRSPRTWRQVGFHLLSFVIETCGAVPVALAWAVGIVLSGAFLYSDAIPALGGQVLPEHSVHGWDLSSYSTLTVLTVIGVISFFGAPWVARGVAALDVAAAEALLGPNRREELTHRVETLSESRAAVVAAADAERRRIERDLHDGAQQRLVSLAMNLGMTRAMFTDLPESVKDAIAQHHEEAKLALAELRGFVRGLHPAVLNDRGLDAALSGLAVRSPVPVRLRVEVSVRPSPTSEAVAYFVVSEALANAAKHARASHVEVTAERGDDSLRLIIRDDGVGGARADGQGGTGLRGLGQRVASVDGTLHIDSPPGGPTIITVELPCA
jgi:signal transduction histidine kinase